MSESPQTYSRSGRPLRLTLITLALLLCGALAANIWVGYHNSKRAAQLQVHIKQGEDLLARQQALQSRQEELQAEAQAAMRAMQELQVRMEGIQKETKENLSAQDELREQIFRHVREGAAMGIAVPPAPMPSELEN